MDNNENNNKSTSSGISNSNGNKTGKGSLTIVGSGYQAVRHFTQESRQAVELADKVLFAIPDLISELWIKRVNRNSESLMDCYSPGKNRADTYREMIERTLKYVREGLNVCVIYYGHPGIFVYASHQSIKLARGEGFDAKMLPGISAEDCLFADLGIDPSTHGFQSFEATDFLLHRRKFDTSCHLVLWQIGSIGDPTYNPFRDNKPALTILVDFLKKYYDLNQQVIIYESPQYVICKPIIQDLPLSKLNNEACVNYNSTLYIPPKPSAVQKIDYKMVDRLRRSELKLVDFHFSIKKLFRLTSNK